MVVVPVILILATACATETESASHWDGALRDSAGIEIVDNFGEALWRPGEEWRLVEDLTIGMREGPPEYQFGRISSFAELSDGRIAVTDRMASKLRFYSPTGEHLLSIGKQGQGPKEFGQGLLGVLRGAGDTLLVTDYRNQQVHRIAPDGSWQASFSTRPDGEWFNSGWDTAPSGMIVSRFSPVQRPDQPPADTLDFVAVRNLDGTLGDTMGVVPTAQSFRFSDGEPERRFYAGRPDIDLRWDGQGLITGRSDTYELVWLDAGGEPERIVRLHREPDPFTPEEQATLMDRFNEMIDGAGAPPERKEQIRRSIKFEDNYPYYRRFMNGPRGTLWRPSRSRRSRSARRCVRPPGTTCSTDRGGTWGSSKSRTRCRLDCWTGSGCLESYVTSSRLSICGSTGSKAWTQTGRLRTEIARCRTSSRSVPAAGSLVSEAGRAFASGLGNLPKP
jgi:hypothetical protein